MQRATRGKGGKGGKGGKRLRRLEKTYQPRAVEDRWSRLWTEKGYGHATGDHPGSPYSIVIPPPNVTGSLHVGHALNNTLQDILIRWRRMQGRNTLWMPGTDHAGIATQNVVERQLLAEGTSREGLGREKFIARVWVWKEQSGGTIVQQLMRLGASCDWARLRFTMDEGLSKAVREAFVRLYDEGLVYRGERLINWCPRCLTALSDIEVEHEQVTGKLYHVRYPLADDPASGLTVATTRPETMLGDTAVAVHPEDLRYRHLIGRFLTLPLTRRTIPIVGDAILVDRELGTGAVKITPSHDFNDFEAGLRHNLPRLSLLDAHGRLDPAGLHAAGVEDAVSDELATLSAAKARPILEERLKERGALIKVESHAMALGKCSRCKTVVEPYLSPQWFISIQPLAAPAIQAVEEGRIRLIPEGWVNNYLGWMREIKDWCISRQIWWGHQIPAWYCRACNTDAVLDSIGAAGRMTILRHARPIVSRTRPERCPDCGGADLIQDPDVLDTWFSSGLWPFSTLGWPDQTPELSTYYPTSTLVTGLDILFFWVARMIMFGLKLTGSIPFRDVYIHALVRDVEGQKMSKSKGNVIDPLGVMETYGTDALRFTLASMASPGRDIRLAEERIEGYRNFANKIWNAARFVLMNLEGPRAATVQSFPNRWIRSRLNHAVSEITAALEAYRFDQAAQTGYQFIWHEYCDWYLELIKPALQAKDSQDAAETRGTLLETFETLLRLLHPFMPFITEEIWQTLPHEGESVMIRPYPVPVPAWESKESEERFAVLEQFVTSVRMGRAVLNYPPARALELYGTSLNEESRAQLQALASHLERLARGGVHHRPEPEWPANVLRLVVGDLTVGILVEGEVDLHKALDRIKKERETGAKEASRLAGKLASADFVTKAPAEVVAEHRERLRAIQHEQEILGSSERQLQVMAKARTK
jgi:valyl-tRNA synthetase